MDVFGPYTRLAKPNHEYNERISLEQAVADNIARDNMLLVPSFGDNGRVYFDKRTPDSYCGGERIFQRINDLSGGIIIPYDFVEIPKDDFSYPMDLKGVHNRYVYKDVNQKFISRPDFFYVQDIDKKAHLIPVDVKGSYDRCSVDDIRQISQYNTAMLYFHSNYFSKIVEYLRGQGFDEVVFENGFMLKTDKVKVLNDGIEGFSDRETYDRLRMANFLYLTTLLNLPQFNIENGEFLVHEEKSRFSEGREKLEEYIREHLKNSISNNLPDRVHAGLRMISGELGLTIDSEYLFLTNNDFAAEQIKEIDLIQRIMFAKNRLREYTVYPNAIFSINGFNGGSNPINRFTYYPGTLIDTGYPLIEEIENRFNRLCSLTDDEIMDSQGAIVVNKIYDTLIRSNQREITVLNRKIKRKLERRINAQKSAKKKQNKINNYKPKKVGRTRETRAAKRRHNKFQKELNQLYTKKGFLQSNITNLRKKKIEEHNRIFRESQIDKGSFEWHKKANEIREKQIEDVEKEREKLLKRKEKWKQKDGDYLDVMEGFSKRLEDQDDARLANSPLFDIPTEVYVQFGKQEPFRILSYSSVPLIKMEGTQRHVYN